jgi:molybdate transport system substrate-binding protein
VRVVVAGVMALVAVLAGCADEGAGAVLRISAASSLTEVFTDLAAAFETDHPGSEVVLSFGGSPALVAQVRQGSPADVLVTADEASMARAVAAGDVREPVVIARNRMALVVESGNPRGITGLDALATPEVTVALCAPTVPCGRLARAVLTAAGVDIVPVSSEENVKAVVTKVALGEVDAGLVYETDAMAAGARVERIPLPLGEDTPSTAYAAAVTTQADAPDLAERWLALLRSPAGRRALERHGFRPA